VTPKPPDWPALRARVSGGLLLPGDAGYGAARRSYNRRFDGRDPAAIARCATVEDVRACVAVAAESRTPVAARSGGHSYAGYSTPDGGFVIDLAGASAIDVRPDGTAVIGAGARLIDVYAALAKAGRCLPAGSCPTVGIAGLTLGGGQGVLTRKYGLTCDRLIAAEVVTADGAVRTASAESEPDLFWALRGGGGGNFGVVTSFTFSTQPAPALAVASLRFPAGSVADVVGAWQEWIAAAPDELWSNCVISGGGRPTCRVGACFVGSTAGLSALLGRLTSAISARPTSRTVQAKGYLDAMRYFAGCSAESLAQCAAKDRESFVATSSVLAAPLADPARLAALMTGRGGVDVLLDGLGGAVSTMEVGDTAFPHRKALAIAQIYRNTDATDAARAADSIGQVRDGLAALSGGGGAYVNYIDPALPDWARAYYGPNLDRLRGVARRYDPDGVFAFAQSVPRT